MIHTVDRLGKNYTLDLMLVASDPVYMKSLEELVKNKSNIRIIPPVAPDQIIESLRGYHVGLYSLTPGSINHKLALPNKIFEYVQAKVCIVCSPNQEIKRLVEDHKVGFITKGWGEEDMIEILQEKQRLLALIGGVLIIGLFLSGIATVYAVNRFIRTDASKLY